VAGPLTARAPRAATAIAVAVALAALSVPLLGAFRQAGAPMEEGKLLIGAELVLDGEVPHRDFEHFYGPADVWALAAAFAVTGPSVSAERAVGLLYTLLLIVAVFSIARRGGGRVAAAAASVMAGAILVPFGVHAYSWIGGLSLLALAVAVALHAIDREVENGRARRWAPHVAGALAGLALLYRADLIVAAALAAAALWPRLDRSQRIAGATAAFVAGGIPYLVHIALAGFGNVWQGMVVDTLFRLRDGRALPMPPPSGALAGWLDRVAPEPPPSSLLPDFDRVFQLRAFFWLTAASVLALVIAAVVASWWRRGDARTTWLLCAAALSAGTVSQMLQRADATHVRFVACIAVPLAAVGVGVVWSMLDARVPRAAVATEAVALAGLFLALAVPYYAVRLVIDSARRVPNGSGVVEVGEGRRAFPVAADVAPQVDALLGAMAGVDGGRIFVGPRDLRLANYSDSYLYFVLGERFRPSGYFLEANPGISNADDSDLAEQLRTADVLVLTDAYDAWEEPNTSRRLGPVAPIEVRDREFCLLADVGRYQVLVARERCQ
jgi:hypothetical protein